MGYMCPPQLKDQSKAVIMNSFLYLLVLTLAVCSCERNPSKQTSTLASPLPNEIQNQVGDSIYKIGAFLFEAKKNAKFELLPIEQKPKLYTKGDTLFSDNQTVILGDFNEIVSRGIYKKFTFKSKFDDFKVDPIYSGPLASPDFNTDPGAKYFKTIIKEVCLDVGVNFAGHYTIVEWGCGTMCQQMAIVDRISGKIIYSQIPFDTLDGHAGSKYKIDSRMLIINTEALSEFEGYEPGYRRLDSWLDPAVYEIIDGRLERIE